MKLDYSSSNMKVCDEVDELHPKTISTIDKVSPDYANAITLKGVKRFNEFNRTIRTDPH